MNIMKYIKSIMLIALTVCIFTSSNAYEAKATQAPAAQKVTSQTIQKPLGIYVKPLTIVNSPKTYLNKTVIMEAKFDKFSTLGLDYKAAMRSSKDYISLLIKRDDTTFNIPLSEMKLFITRTKAEKFIDLKTNDEIQITGVVFSDALGDAWIDISELKILKKAPEEKK